MLRDRGAPTIFLDGDDLRAILAGRWGYSRDERVELARVYFRLCSHLSAQGVTVVISAVAMYDEVREWLKQNVPGAIEIFLEVPEDERRKRDRATKRLYDAIGSQQPLYDEPTAPSLVVANHGHVSAEQAATRIVQHVQARNFDKGADYGRSTHWYEYYTRSRAPEQASSFAAEVAKQVEMGDYLLEVGCGNGRDASFFSSLGIDVVALDVAQAAIDASRARPSSRGVSFFVGDIASLPHDLGSFDVIYSRFCLHAMTAIEEDEFLGQAACRLRNGGRLFIETRSINDPLAREGEVVSKTERIAGHYRRFIVPEELCAKLDRLGFRLSTFVESSGLAALGDDNPVLIRLTAMRGL